MYGARWTQVERGPILEPLEARLLLSTTAPGVGPGVTNEGHHAAAETVIEEEWLSTGVGDGESLTAQGDLGETILPCCVDQDGVMWGIDTEGTPGLHYTTNGDDWTHTGWRKAGLHDVWAPKEGVLLAFAYTVLERAMWRSTDGGSSWSKVFDASDKTSSRHYSLHVAPHGTAIFAEYGGEKSGNSPRKIWRATSDDDYESWEDVYTTPMGTVRYLSGAGYQVAQARWVALAELASEPSLEQGPYRLFLSDDDGRTWTPTLTIRESGSLPYYMEDYGHPTRLLAAGEPYWGVGYLDVVTWEEGTFTPYWYPQRDWTRSYCFALHRAANGLWVAANYPSDDPFHATIQVSPDLERWATIYQFPENESGIWRWAGELGGKLYGARTGHTHEEGFRITVPDAPAVGAVGLQRGGMQEYSENESSAEYSDPGWNRVPPYGALERVEVDDAFHGSYVVRFAMDPVDPHGEPERPQLRTPTVAVTNGDEMTGSVWAKGVCGRIQIRLVAFGGIAGQTGDDRFYAINSDRWIRLTSPPLTIANDNTSCRLEMKCVNKLDTTVQIDFDGLQIQKGGEMLDWMIGGTERVADTFKVHRSLPGEWYEAFTLWPSRGTPDQTAFHSPGDKLYLRSWVLDSTNHLQLYYDPADNERLNLLCTSGGTTETIYTGELFFHQDTPIHSAVGIDAGGHAHLWVCCGGMHQEVTQTTGTFAAVSGEIDCQWGDKDEANGLEGAYAIIGAYTSMDDAAAQEAFNSARLLRAPTAPDLLPASDTGASDHDDVTNLDNSGPSQVLQFEVGGTTAGATVTLYADGVSVAEAVAAGAETILTTNASEDLADGTHMITARQRLPGHSESGDSPTLTVRIDTQAPGAEARHVAGEHGQGAGEVLLQIPDDGPFSEPRTAGVTRLQVEFSEPIDPASFTPASVRLAGNDQAGDPVDLSGIVIAASTTDGDTAGVIEFAPALPDVGRYLVRIDGVSDVAGNPLAGDEDVLLTALAGDALGDLRVSAIDLSYIWANRTSQIDGVTESQTRSDVNCDGRVNAIDLSAAWARRGANMQNVPDPVLPGKLIRAAASGDVSADAAAAAAWAEGERVDALEPADPGRALRVRASGSRTGPGRWGPWAPGAALGYGKRAEMLEAEGASGTRSDDAVVVSLLETLPTVGLGEELLSQRLDVLALPDLSVLEGL